MGISGEGLIWQYGSDVQDSRERERERNGVGVAFGYIMEEAFFSIRSNDHWRTEALDIWMYTW